MLREIIHLNYDWKYMAGFKEQYTSSGFDDAQFETVMIPHANIMLPYNNFNEELFQFISCYRRKITIPEDARGKKIILHFDGVMAYAKVYLNGDFVCDHKGGYTPFSCDLTNHIKYKEENILAVMVDSTERSDIPPFGSVIDYLTYGGIYREVRLELAHEIYVENMFIKTKNIQEKNKVMDIGLFLKNYTGKSRELTLEFSLCKDNDEVVRFERIAAVTAGVDHKLNIVQEVSGVELWDNINPVLYHLRVKVKQTGDSQRDTTDEYTARFGFREAVFKPDGFYLNGKRIKLRGLNHHQSFPYVGYAMPKSAQYKDAEMLKIELGVNLVRLSHYPHSRHFLDRCDELGLLVFEEIPGWQHIGDKEWQSVAVQNVEEMVRRDWNRPSVIIWGVRINESQDNDEFYARTNAAARALDDTRPTGGVRDFAGSRFLEDVYTYNDFAHRGGKEVLLKPKNVTKTKKAAPYLVTEYNGHMFPTKKFDHEDKRVEHALRHARVLNRMYGDPHISGAIGWCMADYNTHKDFGSGDRICYHGVMDMFRIPKEAAAVYASQQDGKPYLEPASSMIIGEHPAAEIKVVYVFTNCDYIKLYKNGECLGSYYPGRKEYPHLPHPPIVITDFIGDLIEKHEPMAPKDARKIKEVLLAVLKYGQKTLPLKYKIRMAMFMHKYKMSYDRAAQYYKTYIANWGCRSLVYEFEGYIGGEAVIRVKKGPDEINELTAVPDKAMLIEDETYDVCRIVVRHTDQYGNTQIFSNEVITLEVEGEGEIIGPKQIALIGGSRAFWVRSTGKKGVVKVFIKSERFEPRMIELKVT